MTGEPASKKDALSVKERLLKAGILEIERSGLQTFSIRRVAAACNVSCAAPYKHFADKSEFILAIIHYINEEWYVRQKQVADQYAGDTRRQIVEVSLAYIRFLLENPQYRSVLMLSDNSLSPEQLRAKSQVSQGTRALIERYCAEVSMPRETEIRKTFVVRSLIYGAALMLDNGELEMRKEIFDFISAAIDREFSLP